MARQLRIEYPGAFYHVMSHGNGFQWIYKSSDNFFNFVRLLLEVKEKYQFNIHIFILMRNHYHLLLETPLGNLSNGMLYLNREFARRFNMAIKRKGSVLKKRYKSILIEKEQYYQAVYRYINQNPMRIDLCKKVENYPGGIWYYLIKTDENNLIKQLNKLVNWANVKTNLGVKRIDEIVSWINNDYEKNPGEDQQFSHLWGSKKWLDKIKANYINKKASGKTIKESKKIELFNREIWLKYKPLHEYKKDKDYKNIVIYILSKYSHLTQGEIAKKLKIKNSNAVGQRLYKIKKRLVSDGDFYAKIVEIEKSKK